VEALGQLPPCGAGPVLAHHVVHHPLQQMQLDRFRASPVLAPARFADLVTLGQFPDGEFLGQITQEHR
jgi:hypothetical protein